MLKTSKLNNSVITHLPEFKVDIKGLKKRPQGKGNHVTKLGGSPDWIQGDDTPMCPKCRTRMVFIGQIDSLDCYAENAPGFMFGDCGSIYIFLCMVQQCDNWNRPESVMQYY